MVFSEVDKLIFRLEAATGSLWASLQEPQCLGVRPIKVTLIPCPSLNLFLSLNNESFAQSGRVPDREK